MSWPNCPVCSNESTKCIDSRWSLTYIRRRYKCPENHRWTTVEINADLMRGYQLVKGSYQKDNFVLMPLETLRKMEADLKEKLEVFQKQILQEGIKL